MHDHRPILVQRVQRALDERIRPRQSTVLAPARVSALVTGEPVPASVALAGDYEPFRIGSPWGLPWQTTWLRIQVDVPTPEPAPDGSAPRHEIILDLGWLDHSPGFQCEGLVRDTAGAAIKAVNPRNQWIPVRPDDSGQFTCYVEAAANPLLLDVPPFQPTPLGDPETLPETEQFTLARADLVRVEPEVRELVADMETLFGLAKVSRDDDARGWELLLALGRAIDRLDLGDVPGTAADARAELAPALATRAHADAHQLSAVGHAHIDSAWLWPIRETRRKVVRTLANAVRLIEDGTGLIFALPAAQHVAWLAEDDSELFARVKKLVASGSIVPVGGMWVEPDAVLPGAEAMARQLTEGLSYFEEAFGLTCREIWLPDSFGYSAAIPQLASLAGLDSFLTQKISWNQVDPFPHHTLWWEGLDGTRIFTHFPPVDTYGAEVTGENLDHAVRNFKDKGHTNTSLMPFGYGDGGGGPTREMLARIDRSADLAGSPKVTLESPHDFFDRARRDYPNAPVWVGELYLELHRGTFTSQVGTKQGNRRSEGLLRTAELWCTTATVLTGAPYPHAELRDTWRTVLLCQFHDILPGTSIAWVHHEVEQLHEEVRRVCQRLTSEALRALDDSDEEAGPVTGAASTASGDAAFNSGPFPVQVAGATVPPLGSVRLPRTPPTDRAPVPASDGDGSITLDNGLLRLTCTAEGQISSLIDLPTGREVVPPGERLGHLQLHQDFPNMWDAWDIDPFYRASLQQIDRTAVTDIRAAADGGTEIVVAAEFGSSTATLTWHLPIGARRLDVSVDVDWHEREKLLKLALPVDVHTDHAQYETQFGHIVRPTHENTSWDAYRFEVSCHRWLRVAESGWGVGLSNRSTYGYDITRHPRNGGGTYSVIRPSLVRGPRFPDPDTDQGRHEFAFSLLPGADTTQTLADGYRINIDPVLVNGGAALPSLVEVDGAVVESVSVAPNSDSDVVVRLYEPLGTRSHVRLRADWAKTCVGTDLRWQPNDRAVDVRGAGDGTGWEFDLRPFEVATVRLTVTR